MLISHPGAVFEDSSLGFRGLVFMVFRFFGVWV